MEINDQKSNWSINCINELVSIIDISQSVVMQKLYIDCYWLANVTKFAANWYQLGRRLHAPMEINVLFTNW